jgi:hypothetical protein
MEDRDVPQQRKGETKGSIDGPLFPTPAALCETAPYRAKVNQANQRQNKFDDRTDQVTFVPGRDHIFFLCHFQNFVEPGTEIGERPNQQYSRNYKNG